MLGDEAGEEGKDQITFSPLCLVVQLCLTLCDPMDCSLLGSSVHGIFQARILEWIAISFSKRRLSTKELMLSNCGPGENS